MWAELQLLWCLSRLLTRGHTNTQTHKHTRKQTAAAAVVHTCKTHTHTHCVLCPAQVHSHRWIPHAFFNCVDICSEKQNVHECSSPLFSPVSCWFVCFFAKARNKFPVFFLNVLWQINNLGHQTTCFSSFYISTIQTKPSCVWLFGPGRGLVVWDSNVLTRFGNGCIIFLCSCRWWRSLTGTFSAVWYLNNFLLVHLLFTHDAPC